MKPKKKKVDFIINKMVGGGAERVVSILANYLSAKGYKVRIITFIGEDVYDLNDSIERIRLHRHPLFQSVTVNGFFNLLSFYRKKSNRPDIISSHIDALSIVTIPVAIIYNIKIIASEHTNHSRNNNIKRKFIRNVLYKHVDALTVLTGYDYDYYNNKKKLKTWLIPNPCSFNFKKNENPTESKQIIAIGALNRYHIKGFDNLILIAKEVLTKHKDWTLKIVGGGDEGLSYLKKEAEINGIADRVIFTGFQSDVQNLLLESEIYILTSRVEGLPMTLLEAMSQGLCCIAFNCVSGPADIITDNDDGLLIEDQNIKLMVDGLNKLIENPELREQFKSRAPIAMNKFSLDSIGPKWISLFEKIQ